MITTSRLWIRFNEYVDSIVYLGYLLKITNSRRTTGLEPANGRVTVCCLTTWLRPPILFIKYTPASNSCQSFPSRSEPSRLNEGKTSLAADKKMN
jgi:hypothetical protein